jgi:nitrogen fixation NifU-like protein
MGSARWIESLVMAQLPEPQLDELYRELILDHYRRPRHQDRVDDPDVVAEGYNPVCGDEIEMELRFDDDRLSAIGIRGRGCSISQASASMMSDLVEGRSPGEIGRLSLAFKEMMTHPEVPAPEELGDLEALQGVGKFAVRVKCATLAWHTLEDGLAQHAQGARGSVKHEED